MGQFSCHDLPPAPSPGNPGNRPQGAVYVETPAPPTGSRYHRGVPARPRLPTRARTCCTRGPPTYPAQSSRGVREPRTGHACTHARASIRERCGVPPSDAFAGYAPAMAQLPQGARGWAMARMRIPAQALTLEARARSTAALRRPSALAARRPSRSRRTVTRRRQIAEGYWFGQFHGIPCRSAPAAAGRRRNAALTAGPPGCARGPAHPSMRRSGGRRS